jgi:hypothetical protein
MKTKEDFLRIMINTDQLTPLQWRGIMIAMDQYAFHYHSEEIKKLKTYQPVVDKQYFLNVIKKLPHSEGRMPYTYHHDYLIQHSLVHRKMSRSEVATAHKVDDVQLYAIALMQLLDEVGPMFLLHLDEGDVIVCKKAKEIAESAIKGYNANPSYY